MSDEEVNILKDKILNKISALKQGLKQKKILLVLVIGVVLLLVVLLMLLFRNKPDEPPKDTDTVSSQTSSESGSQSSTESKSQSQSSSKPDGESKPESASQSGDASSVPEPPKPVTLTGSNISSVGLCIVLPENSGIKDPNIPASRENQYSPITLFSSGNHSEVALHFSDNVVTKDTMTVMCLQAFNIGDASAETATYQVEADTRSVQSYSYDEISDKILYNADGKIIVDVTFAKKKDPRTTMEEYISKSSGQELKHTSSSPLTPQNLLADGTYIYKYDWMYTAFDYVQGHIKELIQPISYLTPCSLEELGYTLDIGAVSKAPPYLTAVSASTVKSSTENGHSGVYTALVYGGERLLGNYTVLQPTYTSGGDGPSNPSSFSLLQAFRRTDLEKQQAAIKFLRRDKPKTLDEDYFKTFTDGPFSEFSLAPALLSNYIVYSDEDIVVYDFFDFAKAPPLEQQLNRLSNMDGYEQYGIKTDWVEAARRSLLEAEGGLGRYIHKNTAG